MKLAQVHDRLAEEERRERRRLERLWYRVRVVPKQLETARRKVARLEREAKELGMNDLL